MSNVRYKSKYLTVIKSVWCGFIFCFKFHRLHNRNAQVLNQSVFAIAISLPFKCTNTNSKSNGQLNMAWKMAMHWNLPLVLSASSIHQAFVPHWHIFGSIEWFNHPIKMVLLHFLFGLGDKYLWYYFFFFIFALQIPSILSVQCETIGMIVRHFALHEFKIPPAIW